RLAGARLVGELRRRDNPAARPRRRRHDERPPDRAAVGVAGSRRMAGRLTGVSSDSGAAHIPPLEASDWYGPDQHLQWLTRRTVGEAVWPVAEAALTELGTLVPQRIEPLARMADRNPPTLRAYDARGQRIDEIEFHPAYKELERTVLG